MVSKKRIQVEYGMDSFLRVAADDIGKYLPNSPLSMQRS